MKDSSWGEYADGVLLTECEQMRQVCDGVTAHRGDRIGSIPSDDGASPNSPS
ncbi:MAG: hypothetical protein V7K55_10640 [Nostoc sp.]|uniref:hypothetical protein n=1 Tax=Nostoc sp. TaxID=1180 RepID=UPI002FF76B2C